ncbi:MAG: DUF2927 domain-containing protein [Rhodobacteraceae bacterium]|nr:DUF2927 domain-containing protein [Paracoccaceae bacterium]
MTRAGAPFPVTVAAAFAAALSACVPVEVSSPRPQPAPIPAPPPVPVETPKSAAARAYFAQVQSALLSDGLLRTDGGGADAPYTSAMLADNFLRIALYDEYSRQSGGFVRAESRSILRRWEIPVRVELRFGASIAADRQATDRARVASYLARLSRITGHAISLVDRGGNFTVHVVSEDEREALGPVIAAGMPGLSGQDIADMTNMPQTTYCMVYALSKGNSGAYTRAIAVVRAEHPDLLRQSCFHEEIAQGLGLANDSPRARPSIFNDDEEFALLTTQDELMLKILYDSALRPGMTLPQAAPIVDILARRLMDGET